MNIPSYLKPEVLRKGSFTASKRHDASRSRTLSVETLEDRRLLSVSAMETYSWYIINQMRLNPPKFADELEGLYRETITSAHGMRSDDPAWTHLRSSISNSDHREHFGQALALLRSQPRLGPLAMSSQLEEISQDHNDWMEVNGYKHSRYEDVTLPPWSDGRWAENIGWASGFAAISEHYSKGTDGYNQRVAYVNTISFMIEVNSDSLGHLRNLLSRDSETSRYSLSGGKNKQIGEKDTIGIDFDQYASLPGKGAVSLLSTHTLSNNDGDSYVTGVAYRDLNHNNYYDVGEGLVTDYSYSSHGDGLFSSGGSITTGVGGTGPGYFAESVSNGWMIDRFAIDSGSEELGQISNVRVTNNIWFEVRVPVGFGLVHDGATMAPDTLEGAAGNDTQSTAVDFGMINYGQASRRTDLLSIHNSNDEDWFRFELAGKAAQGSEIFVGFDHAQGDVEARLYRKESNGNLTQVALSTSSTDNEWFDLAGLAPGEYYLKIYGFIGATNFYSLTPNIQLAPTAEDGGLVKILTRDGDLVITGDAASNRFVVEKVADGQFTITGLSGEQFRVNGAALTAGPVRVTGVTRDIQIQTFGGNDSVQIVGTGMNDRMARRVQAWLGTGDDSIIVENGSLSGWMSIKTGRHDDFIDVYQMTVGWDLHVDTYSGADEIFLRSGVVRRDARVNTHGGNDQVTIEGAQQVLRDLHIDSGLAADYLAIRGADVNGRASVITRKGGDYVDLDGLSAWRTYVNTGSGRDSLVIGETREVVVDRVYALLGSGDDELTIGVGGLRLGGPITSRVFGGNGYDMTEGVANLALGSDALFELREFEDILL